MFLPLLTTSISNIGDMNCIMTLEFPDFNLALEPGR